MVVHGYCSWLRWFWKLFMVGMESVQDCLCIYGYGRDDNYQWLLWYFYQWLWKNLILVMVPVNGCHGIFFLYISWYWFIVAFRFTVLEFNSNISFFLLSFSWVSETSNLLLMVTMVAVIEIMLLVNDYFGCRRIIFRRKRMRRTGIMRIRRMICVRKQHRSVLQFWTLF